MTASEAYRLLEVTPDASDEDVRRAWRDLSKVWHPDRFAHDAELQRRAQEKLKEINAAYETLLEARARGGSRETRAHYEEPRSEPVPRAPLALTWGPRSWGAVCLAAAIFFLLRRPTLGGFIIAGAFFLAAVMFFARGR